MPAGTTGTLLNTATVTPPAGVTDPVPGNNSGTDTNPAGPQADLAITKASTPEPYVPGALLTYTIVVSNAGPSDVSNARVQDALPPPLAGFTWTCTASAAGGVRHGVSGSGNIDALVTLPAGTHATFTVTGTVPAGTTGTLTNTATVTPPLGVTDPVPGNNGATDTNPVGPRADLAVSKSSTPTRTCRGAADLHHRGENPGRANVINARVQDALPRRWQGSPGPARRAMRARVRHGGGQREHRCAGDAAGGGQCDVHGERDGAGGHDRGPDQQRRR